MYLVPEAGFILTLTIIMEDNVEYCKQVGYNAHWMTAKRVIQAGQNQTMRDAE
jgi:hypothetical protein